MEIKVNPLTVEQAAALLPVSMESDAPYILRDISQKKAEAFEIDGCHFITRFEHDIERKTKTLVVMCAEGKNLVSAGMKLKEIAKRHGCTNARMHTRRKGMQRLTKLIGWEYDETIYTMEL